MTHSDSIWQHAVCDVCWEREGGKARWPDKPPFRGERGIPLEHLQCCECGDEHRPKYEHEWFFPGGRPEMFKRCPLREHEAPDE
mgnify:CR=1 FL=1